MIPRSRAPFYLAVMLLILAGLALAVIRHVQMSVPWLPGKQQPVWLVEARIDFEAWGEPVSVKLNIPEQPPGFFTLTEQAASPGYGFAITEPRGDRRAEWDIRSASGPQTLYFKTRLIPDAYAQEAPLEPGPVEAAEVFLEEPAATAATTLLQEAEARSSGPASLTRELINLLTSQTPDQNTRLLLSQNSLADTLVQLLNSAAIPARIADGLKLEDARRQQTLEPWLQVHDGDRWLTFNPRTGAQGVPEDVLLWRQTQGPLLDVMGGSGSRVHFSMLRQTLPALQILRSEASNDRSFGALSLYQLPVEQQSMFRMLLLLPLGALVVCLMRILVGIKTSGTFMPVLIAVAFVQTSLLPGLAAFISVVTLGLVMRGYLSSLNLLLVSRISALIILVLFITAGISIIGYQMGFSTGMTVTFFPMVILAWTIERMSILWEEEGAHEVLIQGAGSLLVAILAYLVMRSPLAEHLSFNFPELHLVVLGIILLLGQYTGYKLTELRRFAPMKGYN